MEENQKTKKVLLYRSIGYDEAVALLEDGHVHGRYYCSREKMTECNLDKVCCFFNDYTVWKSKDHQFFICIEVDQEKILETSQSIWFVSKNFEKSRKVKETKGPVKVEITESYLRDYSLKDVVYFISLYGYSRQLRKLIALHNFYDIMKQRNIMDFIIDKNGGKKNEKL